MLYSLLLVPLPFLLVGPASAGLLGAGTVRSSIQSADQYVHFAYCFILLNDVFDRIRAFFVIFVRLGTSTLGSFQPNTYTLHTLYPA